MTHTVLTVSLVLATLVPGPAALPPPVPAPEATLQRYTLVIGANFGGADRERLKYAVSDAERFAGVMVELGGVAPGNQIVLRQPKLRELFGAGLEVEGTRGAFVMDVRYSLGLKDVAEAGTITFKSRTLMASVGYRF